MAFSAVADLGMGLPVGEAARKHWGVVDQVGLLRQLGAL